LKVGEGTPHFIRYIVDTNVVLQAIASTFGLIGQYFINKQSIRGFYCWLASNAAIITFHVVNGFWIFMGLHVVYFLMAIHGIYLWKGGKPLAQVLGLSKAKTAPAK
jgi:nicotinamide riboside transporter PnuC